MMVEGEILMITSNLDAVLGKKKPMMPLLRGFQDGIEFFIVDTSVELTASQGMQIICAWLPFTVVTLYGQDSLNSKH